jgi:hypothetical protein
MVPEEIGYELLEKPPHSILILDEVFEEVTAITLLNKRRLQN